MFSSLIWSKKWKQEAHYNRNDLEGYLGDGFAPETRRCCSCTSVSLRLRRKAVIFPLIAPASLQAILIKFCAARLFGRKMMVVMTMIMIIAFHHFISVSTLFSSSAATDLTAAASLLLAARLMGAQADAGLYDGGWWMMAIWSMMSPHTSSQRSGHASGRPPPRAPSLPLANVQGWRARRAFRLRSIAGGSILALRLTERRIEPALVDKFGAAGSQRRVPPLPPGSRPENAFRLFQESRSESGTIGRRRLRGVKWSYTPRR